MNKPVVGHRSRCCMICRSRLDGFDVTMIEAFESGALDMKDFYFMGDDYRYHIEVEAKRRFLWLLKHRFNVGVNYKGKTWKWDTIILSKTQELTRFLLGKIESLDFINLLPNLNRTDSLELRKRILSLSVNEARGLGISRSTLHDLGKRARDPKPFGIYEKVADRLARKGGSGTT